MAKQIAALAVFLLLLGEKAAACDACGCSVNGVGVGLMATYRQNFLGFQYQYAPFRSTLEHAQGATDYFHSVELVARFRVFRRFNLQLNQPYRLNVRHHPDGDDQRSGLGDTRLLASYILLDQLAFGNGYRLYAEAGMGAKAPIGHFNANIHDEHNLPENFNPGNGSWAGLTQANLVLGRKNGGITLTGSYQHNRPSTSGYRFGHQWSGQALLFNQFTTKGGLSLTPYCGVAAEGVGRDVKANGKYAASTGGKGWYAAAGINLRFDQWLVGAGYSQPFSQHYSSAEVEAKGRLILQLSYIF
ncbi:MAG: hypothetical protein IPN76_13520 [Saprospiraceae bacterium]|nr:hypothetical protein [Saprospiraceae bacterium]